MRVCACSCVYLGSFQGFVCQAALNEKHQETQILLTQISPRILLKAPQQMRTLKKKPRAGTAHAQCEPAQISNYAGLKLRDNEFHVY